MLSASTGDATVALYLADGHESFTEQLLTTTMDAARSVHAADVDGDGHTDALGAAQYTNTVEVYYNDGFESFSAEVITTTLEGAMCAFAADVDNDGTMDLLSASALDTTVRWFENGCLGGPTAEPTVSLALTGAEITVLPRRVF